MNVSLEEMGFSAQEIALISEAVETAEVTTAEAREPWQPQDLDDVDWVGWRMREIDAQVTAVQEKAAAAVKRLQAAKERLAVLYTPACREIVKRALPRKPDGTTKAKSIDLARVRVGFRRTPESVEIVDEEVLLTYIRDGGWSDELAAAVQVTPRLRGEKALDFLRDNPDGDAAPSILKTPLKEFLKGQEVDTETGEVRARELPGVRLVEPQERFYWE